MELENYTAEIIHDAFLSPLLNSDAWIISKPIRRRDCHIYKARHSKFKTPLAVKIYNKERTDAGTPQALHNALQTYHDKDNAGFNVPEPFAYYADHGAVVMEWINAPKRRNIVLNLAVIFTRKKTIRRAGEWLRWFHDKQPSAAAPYQDTALTKIESITSHADFIAPPKFTDCLSALKIQINAHQGEDIMTGMVHGDFTPYNILHDAKDRIIGIDFTAQNTAPLYADIARFFMYLNSYRPVYISAKSDYEALMLGYGGAPNNTLHRTILFAEVMRRWSVLSLAKSQNKWHLWREIELIRLSFMAKALKKSIK